MFIGEPNGGKTLLAQSIASAAVYYVVQSQMSGKSAFEFQDMLYCRCLLFNEPKVTDVTVETLKNILEGSEVTIDCKFKSGQALTRTPVIMATNANLAYYTSNRSLNKEAFEARSVTYKLKRFPLLAAPWHHGKQTSGQSGCHQ